MELKDKILYLRKKNAISQEQLAEKLNISRQAVSRWETGTAQPDAENILQLSKLFAVSADFLLNNDQTTENLQAICEQAPFSAESHKRDNDKKRKHSKTMGLSLAVFGIAGNFIIYLLSRFVKVKIPHITTDILGQKWYTWSETLQEYSYKYFIDEHNLEFLLFLFWLCTAIGLFLAFYDKNKLIAAFEVLKNKLKSKR